MGRSIKHQYQAKRSQHMVQMIFFIEISGNKSFDQITDKTGNWQGNQNREQKIAQQQCQGRADKRANHIN